MIAKESPEAEYAPRGPILRYSFALTAVATALAITLIFDDFFRNSPYLMFWAAVALSAWYSGLWPSLLAAIISSLVVSFFLLPPTFSLYASLDDLLRLVISILMVVLTTSLYEARYRAARRLINIQHVAAAFSDAVSNQDVAQVMLAVGEALDDVKDVIVVLKNEKTMVDVWATAGVSASLLKEYRQALHHNRLPIAAALNSQTPQWLSGDTNHAEFSGLAGIDLPAVASVPMIVKGNIIGGVEIYFNRSVKFDAELILFIKLLVQECAQAFARSRLYESEAKARLEAERANQLKIQFLGMVSHELRSPLATIKGFASTMVADDIEFSREKLREFAAIIDVEADRLGEMIEQLLDLSQIRAGVFKVNPVPLNLHHILNAAMPQLQTLMSEHHLRIMCPDDLPSVCADERRIVQVLVNLVGNAARYSPPDSTVCICASCQDKVVRIDVSDNGPGIPPDQRQTVFNVFQQAEHGQRMGRGAGLGLAISQGIIGAHGGHIWIDDKPAPGTTVSFTLRAD